jgi:hypothetical protein
MIMTDEPGVGVGVGVGAEVDEMIATVQGDPTTGLVLFGIRNKIGPMETRFRNFRLKK